MGAGHCDQVVFKVVGVRSHTAVQQVAVRVVRIGCGAIVGVIIQRARGRDGRQRRVALRAVADRIIRFLGFTHWNSPVLSPDQESHEVLSTMDRASTDRLTPYHTKGLRRLP